MGRELRDAILIVLQWHDADGEYPNKPHDLEKALDVLRRATAGWVPGEREHVVLASVNQPEFPLERKVRE